jgi:hypothetical protein
VNKIENLKIIALAAVLIIPVFIVILSSHFQSALAYSLPETLDKLFGEFFQKLSNNNYNKTKPIRALKVKFSK